MASNYQGGSKSFDRESGFVTIAANEATAEVATNLNIITGVTFTAAPGTTYTTAYTAPALMEPVTTTEGTALGWSISGTGATVGFAATAAAARTLYFQFEGRL